MKYLSLLAAFMVLSLTACSKKPADTPASQPFTAAPSTSLPASAVSANALKMAQAAPLPPLTQKAQVLSANNVTQYTYLEVMQDNKSRWIATTSPAAAAAKKGDMIQFDDGTLMNNFNSKALNRTFPSITLVGRLVVGNENAAK